MHPGPTAPPAHKLPDISCLFDRIKEVLAKHEQIGLLTVTVIGASSETIERWSDYEQILNEISVFLDHFIRNRMRSTDVLLEPVVAGNTYVLLIGPPRYSHSLDQKDVHLVRDRLTRELRHELAQNLPPELLETYGTYVGSTRIRHSPAAEIDRVVYHGIDQARAEALGQSRVDANDQARALRKLLSADDVHVVYQPLVDLQAKEVIGYEALTRFPAGQFRSPELAFKVASEYGMLWNLERLCRQRALETLPSLTPGQRLFLNVEPDSFYDPRLRGEGFVAELRRSGLDPTRVVLELTERTAVKDFVALRGVLGEVLALGYALALDDVGSGYAGLQTIAEIRPDYLKMDMGLIRNLHLDPIRQELVRSVRQFAESTGTTLVAEGVESRAELETLVATGVRCAQGFLFSRPENPPQMPDWQALNGS